MRLSELKLSQNKKVLVFGDSGSGKTVFATSFPGPIHVSDFDGKISSAAAFLREHNPEKLNQIEFDHFSPHQTQGALSFFRLFEAKLAQHEALVRDGKFPYKTVVVDSLTTFSDAMMQLVMLENPGIKSPVPGVPGLQHYSVLINRFIPLLSKVLALPCNVVMTAHIKTEKNEANGEIIYKPMMSGQLPDRLPIVFEEVYRSFVDNKDGQVIHMAQTRSDRKYACRTQIRGMPQFIPLAWSVMEKMINKEASDAKS